MDERQRMTGGDALGGVDSARELERPLHTVVGCVGSQVRPHVRLSVTPWTVAHQAPLYMGSHQTRILEWVAMPSSCRSF